MNKQKVPNWFVKKWRRLFCRCPYCNKKMNEGYNGLFLNPSVACPDKHYAEEVVMYAGIVVYDVGFQEEAAEVPANVIEFKGTGVPRRMR